LYALEIGEGKWEKESAKRKPTVQELKSKSAIVKKLYGLWKEKQSKKKKDTSNQDNTKDRKKSSNTLQLIVIYWCSKTKFVL